MKESITKKSACKYIIGRFYSFNPIICKILGKILIIMKFLVAKTVYLWYP